MFQRLPLLFLVSSCLLVLVHPLKHATSEAIAKNTRDLAVLGNTHFPSISTLSKEQRVKKTPLKKTAQRSKTEKAKKTQSTVKYPASKTKRVGGGWKSLGAAFRNNPGAAYSATYGDVVVAVNAVGVVKVQVVATSSGTTGRWATLTRPLNADQPDSRPAVVVNGAQFQVFLVSALGGVYYLVLPAALPQSQIAVSPWMGFPTGEAIYDPAAVLLGNVYFVFVISRAERRILYNTLDSSNTPGDSWNALDASSLKFMFSPAAATYTDSGTTRVVVAGVTFSGDLMVLDTTTAAANPITLASLTFSPTDFSCIDSPQIVSTGNSAGIFCFGKDANLNYLTMQGGAVASVRVIPNKDIPNIFTPVYHGVANTITIYGKNSNGTVIFKQIALDD